MKKNFNGIYIHMPTSDTDTDTHIYKKPTMTSQNFHCGMPGNIFTSTKQVLGHSLDCGLSGSQPFGFQFFLLSK